MDTEPAPPSDRRAEIDIRLGAVRTRLKELKDRDRNWKAVRRRATTPSERLALAQRHAAEAHAAATEVLASSAEAFRHAAEAHDRAASMHDRTAAKGIGDVPGHRRQAELHRAAAVADRHRAERVQSLLTGHDQAQAAPAPTSHATTWPDSSIRPPGARRRRRYAGRPVIACSIQVQQHLMRRRMTIVDMKIEVVQVPVADVDRAKNFYSKQAGFTVDVDTVVPGGERVVQLTPPGSGCSIHLTEGGSGPLPGLTLVVADVVAAHAELTRLGAPLSEVVHYENGVQVPGRSDEPWSTMAFFSDPDGNSWIIQERPAAG